MAATQRIAFVANTSWSIYKFRLHLIETLLEKGFAIYILAPRDAYTTQFQHLPGCTYIELTHLKGKSISPLQDWLLYRELLGIYESIRPQLIFHYTIKANIFGTRAAARAKIPSISVITGLGYTFNGHGWIQTAARMLYKSSLKKSTEVWFLNDDDLQTFIKEQLVSSDKTFLLPGEGVDTTQFYPSPYEPGKKEVIFLLIGRLIRHKGIYEFAEAAQQLHKKGLSIKCQLLGFFDEKNPVAIPRQQIDEWTDQHILTYLGHTDRVAPFIEQADCIVLPSYREGMPLSLLEAGSMCKSLIASDTAGCRSIVEEGVNGYLCREKDGTDLAKKMEQYYHLPPAEKKQMGMEGRNKVLKYYTQEIVTNIYLKKINAYTAECT